MDYSYAVYVVVDHGIELWKGNLTYRAASRVIERDKIIFGGKYLIVLSSEGRPIIEIPNYN